MYDPLRGGYPSRAWLWSFGVVQDCLHIGLCPVTEAPSCSRGHWTRARLQQRRRRDASREVIDCWLERWQVEVQIHEAKQQRIPKDGWSLSLDGDDRSWLAVEACRGRQPPRSNFFRRILNDRNPSARQPGQQLTRLASLTKWQSHSPDRSSSRVCAFRSPRCLDTQDRHSLQNGTGPPLRQDHPLEMAGGQTAAGSKRDRRLRKIPTARR